MLSKNKKNALILIGASVALIVIGYLGSMSSKEYYNSLILPELAPPATIFPIAWGIIYTLMIAGAVIITLYTYPPADKQSAIRAYYVQLVLNVIWPYLFFVFKRSTLAFVWLIILFVAVVITFRKFYKLNRLSAYLYIPYLLWLIYAGYINLGVYSLNN